jgi:hypothetical protein
MKMKLTRNSIVSAAEMALAVSLLPGAASPDSARNNRLAFSRSQRFADLGHRPE